MSGFLQRLRRAVGRDAALERLAAAERRNRALLDAIPDNMFRIRGDGTYVDFHSSRPDTLTLPPEQIVGSTIRSHMSEEDADLRMAAIRHVLESGETQSFDLQVAALGGEIVDHEVRMVKSGDDEVLAITRDISDRKQAERELAAQREELRRSRVRIVEAEATERRRLERNLHDGAQQRLVTVLLSLRLAQSKLPSDTELSTQLLSTATEELALALEELRELARGIHPAVLSERGLTIALESLARRSPFPVEILEVPQERLPEQVEVAAFYVAAEALTNVAKYAQASHATVRVRCGAGTVSVEIADDGVGGADPAAGSGLAGLADRVAVLDGTLDVTSKAGEGTMVRAVIPLV